VLVDGTLECVCVERRVESSQLKGNYTVKFLVFIQAIWLKGTQGTYVNKKLMLLVALVELQKLVS
jgi:hypothetical protein